ncbi:transposase [Corallococcus sp. M34]|uniref:transposase n=1 Tax=Citreicoccus inhibens TaxID=2849499 RepID=UPI0038B27A24|nr:transposase [Citreicoccus inhibens]
MRRHELSDAEWSCIEAVLSPRTGPRSKRGDRDCINAVMWRVKAEVPWRDPPERSPSRNQWSEEFRQVSRLVLSAQTR